MNSGKYSAHYYIICETFLLVWISLRRAALSRWWRRSSRNTLDDWRRAAETLTGGEMLFNHSVLIVLSDYSVPYAAVEMFYKVFWLGWSRDHYTLQLAVEYFPCVRLNTAQLCVCKSFCSYSVSAFSWCVSQLPGITRLLTLALAGGNQLWQTQVVRNKRNAVPDHYTPNKWRVPDH